MQIQNFPIYWRWSRPEDNNHYKYGDLNLVFGASEQGVISQKIDSTYHSLMRSVYAEEANIGYLQEGHSLCESYGGDFFGYLVQEMQRRYQGSPARVLEVGCGGAVLLKRLRSLGHDCTGIDPSPISARALENSDIKHIPEMLSSSLNQTYDVIFHMDILEHAFDPKEFMERVGTVLRPNGIHVVSIPDCSESIRLGDWGMLMHQHVTYFDVESFTEFCYGLGIDVLRIQRSAVGGSIYATLSHRKAFDVQQLSKFDSDGMEKKFQAAGGKFLSFYREACQTGGVGFWAPLRAMPYLSLVEDTSEVRLFDHDSTLRGLAPSGSALIVEDQDDLLDKPVSTLVILSITWGGRIESRLRAAGYRGVVVQLADLLR